MIKKLCTRLLIFSLIFQLGLPLSSIQSFSVSAAQNNIPQGSALGSGSQIPSLLNVEEGTPAPKPKAPFNLPHQKRIIYNADGTVQTQFDLSSFDLNVPPVRMTNPAKQIKVKYDFEKKELHLNRVSLNRKTGKHVVSDAHVFTGIELTSEQIVNDANFIAFATTDGIRVIFWPLVTEAAFVAPIPLFLPVTTPPWEGAKITGLEFLTPVSEPRELLSSQTLQLEELAFSGDLIAEVTAPAADGTLKKHSVRFDRSQIIESLRKQYLLLTLHLMVTNPNLSQVDGVLALIQDNKAELDSFLSTMPDLSSVVDPTQSSPQQMLVNLAQRLGTTKLLAPVAKKDPQAKDAMQTLAGSPRNVISTRSWPSRRAAILETTAAVNTYHESNLRPVLPWENALAEVTQAHLNTQGQNIDTKGGLSDLPKTPGKVAQLFQKAKLNSRLLLLKTLSVKGLKISAYSIITGLAVYCTDGFCRARTGWSPIEWSMSIGTNMIDYAMRFPAIEKIAEPLKTAGSYFNGNAWKILLTGAGIVVTAAYVPVSLFTAWIVARFNGQKWSAVEAFFNYGTQLYAKLNYPFVKVFWESVVKSKNLYPATLANVDPFEHPVAFAITRDENSQREKASRLNDEINSEAKVKARSLLIAAALVAEKDHENIISLLKSAEQGSPAEFVQLIATGNISPNEVATIAKRVSVLLTESGIANPNAEIDAKSVQSYYEIFTQIAEEIKSKKSRSAIAAAAMNTFDGISSALLGYWTSIRDFSLLGRQMYEKHLAFNDAEVDPNSRGIAWHHYWLDYMLSNLYTGLTMPERYGALAQLKAHGIPAATDQAEQVGFYGVQGAVDAMASKAQGDAMKNPYLPLTQKLFEPQRTERRQTFLEVCIHVVKALANPDYDSLGENQVRSINTALTGFQTRLIVGAIPRMIGLTLGAIALTQPQGVNPLDTGLLSAAFFILEPIVKAVILQTYVNVTKISMNFGPFFMGSNAPMFFPGYVLPWASTYWAQRVGQGVVNANRSTIERADFMLATGIDNSELVEMRTTGIELTLKLFEQSKIPLPLLLDGVKPTDYSIEQAQELLNLSLSNASKLPPTKESFGMVAFLNSYGTAASTLLYTVLTLAVYSKSVTITDATTWLLGATASLAVTHAGLKVMPKITRPLLRKAGQLAKKCKELLTSQTE